MVHLESDLVIVSSGALLPGAANGKEFFQHLLRGRSFVHDLRDARDLSFRPQYRLIHSSDRNAPDASYSTMGADIPRQEILALAHKFGLDFEGSLPLHIMSLEAIGQCLGDLLDREALSKTDLIFGSPDALAGGVGSSLKDVFYEIVASAENETERATYQTCFAEELERFAPGQDQFAPPRLSIPSNLTEKIRSRFSLGGSAFLVDAACASSFAALYLAKLRLEQGLCRYAIVGGADDCLGSGNMMSGFSKLGVLSETGPLPFDERSDGTVIGEGAVAFLVTTLKEARDQKLPILGVVRGIGGSSDGKKGGLTEPTAEGQMRCYRNAYGAGGPPKLAYVECHGTGTRVGDRVELESLSAYLPDQNLPIGSVKYNVGHTMIAAGAVSLLKCLEILRERIIPPSPYLKTALGHSNLYLNKEAMALPSTVEPISIGISSFGFGGTNFHLWLQEYKPSVQMQIAPSKTEKQKILLSAVAKASLEQVSELFGSTNYPLPPKVWPFIDRAQLLSVLLAEKLFRDNGIQPEDLERDKVNIISGAAQPLVLAREMVQRGLHTYAYRLLKWKAPQHEASFSKIYQREVDDSTELNEQSAIGSINSLTAARVSKAFDFLGLNFNVDGDQAAGIQALEVAKNLLQAQSGAALVFESLKIRDAKFDYLRTVGMRCYLLSTADFAERQSLPILGELGQFEVERTVHGSH